MRNPPFKWADEALAVNLQFRRSGTLDGELAVKFKEWLEKLRKDRGVAPNPSENIFPDEEIIIAPWMYDRFGWEGYSPFELAAIEAYHDGFVSNKIAHRRCFYDKGMNRIAKSGNEYIDLRWWIRSYMDYVWENLLAGSIKSEWKRLALKRENTKANHDLMMIYALSVQEYGSPEELTFDSSMRASLSEATSLNFTGPSGVDSAELVEFVDQYCWPFFFRKDGR